MCNYEITNMQDSWAVYSSPFLHCCPLASPSARQVETRATGEVRETGERAQEHMGANER